MNKDYVLNPTLTFRSLGICALALALVPAMAAGHRKHHRHVAKHVPAKHAAPKKAPVAKPVSIADPTIKPLVGDWYVNDHGKESRAQRLALRPDGTFAFVGAGWQSGGKYSVKEGSLALEWSQVDGTAVKPGSMHKTLPLNADMNAFTIDRYNYAKHAE